MTISSFLEDLAAAAQEAQVAETAFRRGVSTRIAELERDRSFAFRRVNLMKEVAAAISPAEDEGTAVAYGCAALRVRLGWEEDSEARAAVLAHFAAVPQAMFAAIAPDERDEEPDIGSALAEFETWYARTHTVPFWALFEHYMPQTPLVDF